MPYSLMKNEKNISFSESTEHIEYHYETLQPLSDVKSYLNEKLKDSNFDINIIKNIIGLIYINMAPMHYEKFSKTLWFSGISMLNNSDR